MWVVCGCAQVPHCNYPVGVGAEDSKNATLWHYTDAAGAIGILQSNTLRATVLSHLNDATELTYGLQMAQEILRECIQEERSEPQKFLLQNVIGKLGDVNPGDYFVACASLAKDDLSQWRGYGRDGGYALGFNANLGGDEVEWAVASDSIPNTVRLSASPYNSGREPFGSWQRVLYEPEEQRSELRDTIRVFPTPHVFCEAPGILLDVIVSRVACYKSPGFSGEKEYRVVAPRRQCASSVAFRSGPFGVTPYVPLSPVDLISGVKNPCAGQRDNPLPVVEVTVGPTHTPDAAVAGMRRLLDSLSLHSVPVTSSSSTYRRA